MTFSTKEEIDAFYDEVDRQLAASGRRWYFLVNYIECVIGPDVWGQFASRGKNCLKIDLVGLAAIDQPAGWMSDRVHVRIFDCAEDSFGNLPARLFLAVMDGG